MIIVNLTMIFQRYTEIWSDDESSKAIKLAEPQLELYNNFPELVLVDTKFCVKPWIKIYLPTTACIFINIKWTVWLKKACRVISRF